MQEWEDSIVHAFGSLRWKILSKHFKTPSLPLSRLNPCLACCFLYLTSVFLQHSFIDCMSVPKQRKIRSILCLHAQVACGRQDKAPQPSWCLPFSLVLGNGKIQACGKHKRKACVSATKYASSTQQLPRKECGELISRQAFNPTHQQRGQKLPHAMGES